MKTLIYFLFFLNTVNAKIINLKETKNVLTTYYYNGTNCSILPYKSMHNDVKECNIPNISHCLIYNNSIFKTCNSVTTSIMYNDVSNINIIITLLILFLIFIFYKGLCETPIDKCFSFIYNRILMCCNIRNVESYDNYSSL